jgi:ABC-2 type transport system permease protein
VAGVTQVPDKQAQLRLVAWLRWRLFVNGLRTGRGKADLATKIIVGAGITTMAALIGPLLGLGSWYAISHGMPLLLVGELWFVFVVWLLVPIFISGFSAEANPASLLRFPLRYSTFVLLAFAHGVFDPVAVAALYWLVPMLVGIGVASPGAILWAIPALSAFALLNLLLNRTIFAWLSRWFAQRRTREILGALFILVMFSFQLIGPLTQRYGKRAMPMMTHFSSVNRVLPPGMAALVILDRHAGRGLVDLAGLLAYSGVLAWLLAIRLRAEYRGESFSEARRETTGPRPAVQAGWNLTGLSPTVAALLEKDLRYLLRNTTGYFTLMAPIIVVIMLSLAHGNPHGKKSAFMLTSSTFFPMGVAYVLLTLVGLTYNSLGYDGPGLSMLFAAPIRFRDVLAAKNLLHSMLVVVEVFVVYVLVQFIAGPTPPLVVAVTLAGALWVLFVNLAAGNLVSLYFPRKLNFGQMRRQRASGMAAAASMGIQALVVGLAAGAYFLSRWAGHVGLCGIAFLALAGGTWVAYGRVLDLASGIAWKRRELLVDELSRSE